MLRLFFIFAILLTASAARAQSDYEALNRALTDEVAVPAYARMAHAMTSLREATAALCTDPNADRLGKAKDAFHAAMNAWQRAQPINFGPVTDGGRTARIAFWPDKNGTAARQVRRALKDQDPALIADGGLDGKSVALQNLATYERLVFGGGPGTSSQMAPVPDDRYACALAAQIAAFQSRLAAEILEDWVKPEGFRDAILTAAAGNAHYTAAKQPATDFLKSLTGALDSIVQLKLERPLGKEVARARPQLAESWRSARSLDNILANLETARALYETPGAFGELLRASGAAALDDGLRRDFAATIAVARAVTVPLRVAVGEPAHREKLVELLERLKSLRLLIAGPVASEIGLVVGFNALDGD
jgi:predicted lipoprotein